MRPNDLPRGSAPDDTFFTMLGILFACAISFAAAMVLILPETAIGRVQTRVSQAGSE